MGRKGVQVLRMTVEELTEMLEAFRGDYVVRVTDEMEVTQGEKRTGGIIFLTGGMLVIERKNNERTGK